MAEWRSLAAAQRVS